jgi:putative transcriptional regulator
MNKENLPDYLTGYFLISETDLTDPNFFQTVVLLVDHNDEGAFGLVVNRRSTSSLGSLVEDFESNQCKDLPVYVGGPVQQNILFTLHSGLPNEDTSSHSITPIPGVTFEPDFRLVSEHLKYEWSKIEEPDRPAIHLYAGYAGWGAGQLEGELEHDSWVVIEAVPEMVFSENPEESWRQALKKKGGIYWIAAETGSKPSMN